DEDVLERDHVRLHPENLRDVRDPAGAVDQAADLDQEVEGARDLLANRAVRQLDAGRHHQRLEPRQRVAWRVRVDRRQRTFMARVHRLQHVERLWTANLADDDTVGAHTQGVPHELADSNLSLALDVRGPRLERDHVLLLELELRRVLDRDDPLDPRNERRHRVQRGRLTRARTARDQDVELPVDAGREELRCLWGDRPEVDQVVHRVRVAGELPDREGGAPERERWNDRVDTRAVGQARVHHRRRLVDAAADRGDDLVDDAHQMRVVEE